MKSKSKNKNKLNEKAINNILEDFKTAYPIKEKLQQLYTITNYYNTNKKDSLNEQNNDIKYSTNGHLTTNSLKNININSKTINNIKNNNEKNKFFTSFKNQQLFKRKNVFRQNVFNNLVSTNRYSIGRIPDSKILNLESNNKIKPFNGTDYQSFIKKVEITNPIINKNLESINFYGPYFSHCPPCYNRNLDYYKNLEVNQCLDIIHHIKKMRMKTTLLDIKKSANTEGNKSKLENDLRLETESLKSNENNN